MKKSKILIHIPHSSLKFPLIFKKNVILEINKLNEENFFMTDLYTDKLVSEINTNKLIFPYSRLFCDVERFRDDKLEIMSKIGMGCVYNKTSKNEKLINYDNKYKEHVLVNYYDKHHHKLDKLSTKIINNHGKCIIIDLHSFSDELVNRLLDLKDNPEICIGIDDNFNDNELSDFTISFFKEKGYTVKLNYPYGGSIVPNKYYHTKDKRIKTIMIEINKRIYLNNNEINKINFNKLKHFFEEYIEVLENKYN